ncbi:MAG: hypothetical protein ACI8T1_002505 [Verrucomicrobiales bacterium]|jgi:hypothetical protein
MTEAPTHNTALGAWIAVVFAGLAWALYLENGDWPAAYHHDEPSKVEQIQESYRNLNHPLLLLETTDLLGAAGDDGTVILRRGRLVSAFCMVLAVGALVMAATRRHSWMAGLFVGGVSILYFRFYEVGHYFKEDTPFLLGLALVMWAVSERMRAQNSTTAVMLGLAAGFAMSSKYAGVGMFAIVLPVAILYREGSHKRTVALVLAAALGMFLLVHARFLFIGNPFQVLSSSVTQEVTWLVHGHKGIGTEIPSWDYAERLRFDLGYHGLALLALWVVFFRRLTKADAVLLLFGVTFFIILTMSRK